MSLEDIEAIKQLKYAYFRLLDLKKFDELAELLTEDATASYEDGKSSFSGRAGIVGFLRDSLTDTGIITEHHGHHPEIVLTSATTASGCWYLQDRVVVPGFDIEIGGTAFSRDEYAEVNGVWLISHTGYQRVFEEHRTHTTGELKSFSSRFDTSTG